MSAGETGLIVTDENGKSFLVDSPKVSSGERILFSSRIKRLDCKTDITNEEREKIISKLLELAPEIKWQIH
jgi:hypothetical protein